MVFSSLVFLFHFLPLFLLLYYICPAKWKNAVLFAGSVKNEPWYFFLFLLSVLVNYHIGLLLGRRRWLEHRKKWLIFGLCYNLIWLFLFKYSGFFAGNLNWIFKKNGNWIFHPDSGISITCRNQLLHLSSHLLPR